MRYRALDSNLDMTFGKGALNFLVDSPAAVAQSVLTRLKLSTGEWFLDQTAGTPWSTQVLGTNTQNTYDLAIRTRILNTTGVTGIVNGSYSSTRDPVTRRLSVSCVLNTVYGQVPLPEVTI